MSEAPSNQAQKLDAPESPPKVLHNSGADFFGGEKNPVERSEKPYLPFYAEQWLADREVRMMGDTCRGIYIDMISLVWVEEGLEGTFDRFGVLLGIDSRRWRKYRGMLLNHFTQDKCGKWWNKRALREFLKMSRRRWRKEGDGDEMKGDGEGDARASKSRDKSWDGRPKNETIRLDPNAPGTRLQRKGFGAKKAAELMERWEFTPEDVDLWDAWEVRYGRKRMMAMIQVYRLPADVPPEQNGREESANEKAERETRDYMERCRKEGKL